MSKAPVRRKLRLEELREQGFEALGADPSLDIDLEDGTVVTVDHPMLTDDATQAKIDKAEGAVETAKAILGEVEHKRFLAAGGRSNDVVLAWALLGKSMEGPTARG